jgi:hypothetical protein
MPPLNESLLWDWAGNVTEVGLRCQLTTARRQPERNQVYAAFFALGFIFPCAQRCFNSRDSFLRAAALIRRRQARSTTLRRPVEFRPSMLRADFVPMLRA